MAISNEMTDAFESFAHSLRIMVEAHIRARDLLMVDPHEAVGNIEQALTQTLNSIASIYDVSQKIEEVKFDWYGTPETAVLLSIRNARHHNHANRIRGLYDYHLRQENPERPRRYVFVNYPESEDGGKSFDIPVSWYDLANLLDLPQSKNRIRPSAVEAMKSYLLYDKLNSYATQYEVSSENIFLNLNPLIVNGGIKFVPNINKYINPRSMEGRWFSGHFENVFATNILKQEVQLLNVFIPC